MQRAPAWGARPGRFGSTDAGVPAPGAALQWSPRPGRDEAATADGAADGRPLALRPRRLRQGLQEAARDVTALGRSQACAGPRPQGPEPGVAVSAAPVVGAAGPVGGAASACGRAAPEGGPRAEEERGRPGVPGAPTWPPSPAPGGSARRRPPGPEPARGVGTRCGAEWEAPRWDPGSR